MVTTVCVAGLDVPNLNIPLLFSVLGRTSGDDFLVGEVAFRKSTKEDEVVASGGATDVTAATPIGSDAFDV